MTSQPGVAKRSASESSSPFPKKTVLVTGADGFIGKNLCLRLQETGIDVVKFVRSDDTAALPSLACTVDSIIHLAGENRPNDESAFDIVNRGLTQSICDAIAHSPNKPKLLLASSTQAERDNPYGRSKLAAEQAVVNLSKDSHVSVAIFRLPGVFGKWCKPNYNSVVATFCHNIARDLPIQINDPNAQLRLVYVDDVVNCMIEHLRVAERSDSASVDALADLKSHDAMSDPPVPLASSNKAPAMEQTTSIQHSTEIVGPSLVRAEVSPEYSITLGELADQIRAFESCRSSLVSERVGSGLVRALYATYISYLPTERFSYEIVQHSDPRGTFVEMLKTHDSGQFSFFTAHPGVTRGGHYHHSKTEKFLVIKGRALFRFRHLLTDERFELNTTGDNPTIVDTIPGWVHDITNTGDDEMVVMLWANENFDRERPDTISGHL